MGIETTRWDVADHLDSVDAVLAYLEAVFEDGDPELIAAAPNDVTRAKGIANDPAMSGDTEYRGGDPFAESVRPEAYGEGGVRQRGHNRV